MLRIAVCFAVVLVMAIPVSAEAGAWTKRRHEGLFISGLGFHWLDPHDQPANLGNIKIEASLYVEFGLTDRITLVGRAGYQQLHDRIRPIKKKPAPPRTGIGGIEVGARVGLRTRGRWASSIQIMAGIPGSGENWLNEEFGARGGDLDTRLLIGRSLGDHAFIEIGTGVRLRGEGAADEIRLDVTAGCDLIWKTRLMVQSYSVWALGGDLAQPAYAGHRMQTSLLMPLRGPNTLQLSVLRTVNQQRMSEEFAVMASLWRSF